MGLSHAYGQPLSYGEDKKLLEKAIDLGYTFFDTAEVYGPPENPHENEEILGKVLKPYRSKIKIATKFGICFDTAKEPHIHCLPTPDHKASLNHLKDR